MTLPLTQTDVTAVVNMTLATLSLCSESAIVVYVRVSARGGVAESLEEVKLWSGYSSPTVMQALKELETRQLAERCSLSNQRSHGRRFEIRLKTLGD
jgi:hypothetical protein